jgi:hypothetical protein
MSSRITLIFSIHKEIGICNSNALVKILKSISPDIIFEELSKDQYQESYDKRTLNNLESVAIGKYVKTHPIPHIPIDTFQRPESYHRDQDRLIQTLTGCTGKNSFHYRNLLEQKNTYIFNHGFNFLNSSNNEKLFDELKELEEKILTEKDQDHLWKLSSKVRENLAKREDTMLDNVYAYARKNEFRQGLMLIGSGHQKSIKQKIKERKETEDIKIEWSILPVPELESHSSI